MEKLLPAATPIAHGADIIEKAEGVGLDPRLLYETVIDLSTEGLLTANCINIAAGIILQDLGLPRYFFEHIQKDSLEHLLKSIANAINVIDGNVTLYGKVANIDFDVSYGNQVGKIRIATEETQESMETMLEDQISGHRREYYYSAVSKYSTYIIRPETVADFSRESFADSRFLFSLAGDYAVTPEPTRQRYEKFLQRSEQAIVPHIEVFNLPVTGETRIMFNSDFEKPQLPLLRKLLHENGLTLVRAYWEPYLTKAQVPSSVCALYVQGELDRKQEDRIQASLRSFLSYALNRTKNLYLQDELTFEEMLFAGNAIDFTHLFIYKESENVTDLHILKSLGSKDLQDVFAKRLYSSNKSIYGVRLITDLVEQHLDLIKLLYTMFNDRFNPEVSVRLTEDDLEGKWREFDKVISSRFIDFSLGYDIFKFMFKIVGSTLKTNFYKEEKRSFSFRFDNSILDPLVFGQFVHGIFFVNGHYACGTHMRAADIARGGLRLLRVTRSNHSSELDNAVLLNYALGPKAQRLKHKDICESGSKGVVIPHPQYATYAREALFDYTEGIMDLMLLDDSIVDYLGRPELIFFGPDEGTAPLMDGIAFRAKERGYRHWRTITTGKSFGIPHDTYGLLEDGELFGLFNQQERGVDLQIEGKSVLVSNDMEKIYDAIGDRIHLSGMTTTSIMSTFRTLIGHRQQAEEDLNLMITGGPDGDLGANEIQCFKGKICLVIDGGSILFDPAGLDRRELMKLAFMRNSDPRANSIAFPLEKLGPKGFRVPLKGRNVTLPDGTMVEDGALFHKTFLYNGDNRRYIEEAGITAFIPCGGFKDTIHQGNVKPFLELFKELKFIVEGANVFFDDVARRHIALSTDILQIKDSTANKGGVFSSSVSEVLTAFLLENQYEKQLLDNVGNRWSLIHNIMTMVARYAELETTMLLKVHAAEPTVPLFALSEQTSEKIFSFQDLLLGRQQEIMADRDLVWKTLEHYIPPLLVGILGRDAICQTLYSQELKGYLEAILSKKLASMAYYRFCLDWQNYLQRVETSLLASLNEIFAAEV
ncbi:MAG: NAD-glutamate dehydrogenase domain-containing protein [Desulfopila sp.]